MPSEPTVYVVDDDVSVRRALELLIQVEDLSVKTYASAEEFLEDNCQPPVGCLVVDMHMPGMSGLELQQELIERQFRLPVIILTGRGTVPATVQALQRGAVDFIEKPYKAQSLLERIREAIELDTAANTEGADQAVLAERLSRLTPREQQVLAMLVTGSSNKVIAIDLGISERTVELHRSRIMTKAEARTLPELVRLTLSVDGSG